MFLSVPVENLTIGWAGLIAVASLLFGIYQYVQKRNEQKCSAEKATLAQEKADKEKADAVKCAAETAAKTQGREEGIILTQLGAANKGIADIQLDMRRMEEKREEQHLKLSERVTAVESKAASAHHRLDTLEETVSALPKNN